MFIIWLINCSVALITYTFRQRNHTGRGQYKGKYPQWWFPFQWEEKKRRKISIWNHCALSMTQTCQYCWFPSYHWKPTHTQSLIMVKTQREQSSCPQCMFLIMRLHLHTVFPFPYSCFCPPHRALMNQPASPSAHLSSVHLQKDLLGSWVFGCLDHSVLSCCCLNCEKIANVVQWQSPPYSLWFSKTTKHDDMATNFPTLLHINVYLRLHYSIFIIKWTMNKSTDYKFYTEDVGIGPFGCSLQNSKNFERKTIRKDLRYMANCTYETPWPSNSAHWLETTAASCTKEMTTGYKGLGNIQYLLNKDLHLSMCPVIPQVFDRNSSLSLGRSQSHCCYFAVHMQKNHFALIYLQ